MFRKLAIVAVMMVYALSSTGAIVHLDYCCGKLSRISLSTVPNKKDNCHNDKMEGKSCCDSKQFQLSVKGEQEMVPQKAAHFSSASDFVFSIHEVYFFFNTVTEVKSFSNGPPLYFSSPPLFLQHCIFRI